MKTGWPYIAVVVFLTWGLLFMKWEQMAPFYAVGLMIVLSFARKETRLTGAKTVSLIAGVGRLIAQTTAIILPVGIIIAGLTTTGSILSITNAIVALGRENTFVILLLGMAACYVMGMAGLLVPAYIFLAVTMAPAVIKAGGLNPVGVHLFIAYFSMLSLITLPVAAAAFVASAMANAHPMKTSAWAMKLGVVLYFIPFFFVYSPPLVLQGGTVFETLYITLFCFVGVALIASGLEGYLWGVGPLDMWARPIIVIAGFLIGLPEWTTTVGGAAVAIVLIAVLWLRRRRGAAVVRPGS